MEERKITISRKMKERRNEMKENREPVHRARVQTFEIEYVRVFVNTSFSSFFATTAITVYGKVDLCQSPLSFTTST